VDVERQFRNFGWGLLGLWLSTIVYMTRDFWFPSAFFVSEPCESPTSTPRRTPPSKVMLTTAADDSIEYMSGVESSGRQSALGTELGFEV